MNYFPMACSFWNLLHSISQRFGRARPLIHSYKSQLYPMLQKPFGGKSHWLYHQNVFRMRMFSSSSTEIYLAQDIFVLHLNNFNISLSSLSAQSCPFPQTSSQQHGQTGPFNTYFHSFTYAVAKLCLTLCDLMGPSRLLCPWDFILEWVTISFPRESPSSGSELMFPVSPALAGHWATWEVQQKL